MLLLINPYDGVNRRVLDCALAGRRLPDFVTSNLASLRPVDARLVEPASGWRVDRTDLELLSNGVDVLVIDADVWLSRRALEQLLRVAGRRDLAVKVTLPTISSPRTSGLPDLVALYLPALVAPSVLLEIGDGLLQQGIGAARDSVGEALLLDGRHLDADDPPLRVSSLAHLATLERRILLQRALAALDAGVRIRDPHQVAIRGEFDCGADVEIDIDVIIEGRVTLSDGVQVGAHSILINSTIGKGTLIRPYSIIEQARIGSDSVVGPYARVRPGTVTGEAVQIGNFVEIKNAEIGSGSRINHLSFIGDAAVGSNVTLGAATITCNHSHHGAVRTEIGDGAYVGSGTELVAPVIIGENATIGAGSTITDDVDAGTLALARERQVSVPGWRPAEGPPSAP